MLPPAATARPLLVGAHLTLAVNGKSTPIKEVLTTSDIYLSAPGLAGQTGKQWVKIPLSLMKGAAGASLSRCRPPARRHLRPASDRQRTRSRGRNPGGLRENGAP